MRFLFARLKIRRLIRNLSPVKLNVGCGKNKLEGWINVDIEPDADIVLDLKQGIPYSDQFVNFLYCEHFLEHLTVEEGKRCLKESYRVLKDDGVLRIAMPDLESLVEKYQNNWKDQDWLSWPEHQFIQTRAEMLNVAFRWWGHQYLYDYEELVRRLKEAGFQKIRRCIWGESSFPDLRNLETRVDSKLIVESEKK